MDKNHATRWFPLLLFFLLSATPARADVVTLKSGEKITGVISAKSPQLLHIKTFEAPCIVDTISLKMEEVDSITRATGPQNRKLLRSWNEIQLNECPGYKEGNKRLAEELKQEEKDRKKDREKWEIEQERREVEKKREEQRQAEDDRRKAEEEEAKRKRLEVTVVGSAGSNIYHYPGCYYASKIHPKNLMTFGTIPDALAHGYHPCKSCRPPQE